MVREEFPSVQECLKKAQSVMGAARTIAGDLYRNPAEGYTKYDSAKEKKVQMQAKKLEYEDIPQEISKRKSLNPEEMKKEEDILYSCLGRLYSAHIKLDADLNGPLGDLLERNKGAEAFGVLQIASDCIGIGSSLIRIIADRINWQSVDNLSLKVDIRDCITEKYMKSVENSDKDFIKNFLHEIDKYKRQYENCQK